MSAIAITSSGSGAGTLSIAAPITATNRTLTLPDETGTLISTATPGYNSFKNRLINGQMQIAQRATSGTSGSTVPSTAPTYPSVDRWYAYATGATVTVAQVAGSGANKNNLQATGAASVTAVGIGQRIEALNSYDLAGSTATLSVNISNSLLTTVTWTASYATSADTWSAKTQIATGTFTVTSSLVNYSAQISVPAAATTGIEILFTVGAQTSGTWVIGNAQLEKSSIATTFDYRPYTTELQLCQRYYYKVKAEGSASTFAVGFCQSTTAAVGMTTFPTTMRIAPSALEQSGTAGDYRVFIGAGTTCSAVPVIAAGTGTPFSISTTFTVASGLTANSGAYLQSLNSSAYLGWSAEL